jgi:hypothetical protein
MQAQQQPHCHYFHQPQQQGSELERCCQPATSDQPPQQKLLLPLWMLLLLVAVQVGKPARHHRKES